MKNLMEHLSYSTDNTTTTVKAVATFTSKIDKTDYNADPKHCGVALQENILKEILSLQEVKDIQNVMRNKYVNLLQQIVECETVADLKNLFLYAVAELNKEKNDESTTSTQG